MARALRIEYPGAWYHFTCRGNERNSIFKDDSDRNEFLNILQESLEKYKVELHGYVLMRNHFHLILHTPFGNLNRFAQRFNTAYIVYYNKRHKRIGHLYQGRYKAILVEKESYLLELSRYIHLNPAKIRGINMKELSTQLSCLRNYHWSSNLGYGLLRHRDEFVCYKEILEYLGGDNRQGRKSYREFVEEGLLKDTVSPFEDVKGQVILGKSSFADWIYENVMKRVKPDLTEQSRSRVLIKEIRHEQIISKVCEVFKVDKEQLLKSRSKVKEARMVYIELCYRYRLFHRSLKEIGQELGGLTVGGMSRVRKKLRERLKMDDALRVKHNRCINSLDKE